MKRPFAISAQINIAESHHRRQTGSWKSWKKRFRTAIRMLDNVIDINYYPTDEARNSQIHRHRPIGLGSDGFPGRIWPHVESAMPVRKRWSLLTEAWKPFRIIAIMASSRTWLPRARYLRQLYLGSKWDRGLCCRWTPLNVLEHEQRAFPVRYGQIGQQRWTGMLFENRVAEARHAKQ